MVFNDFQTFLLRIATFLLRVNSEHFDMPVISLLCAPIVIYNLLTIMFNYMAFQIIRNKEALGIF